MNNRKYTFGDITFEIDSPIPLKEDKTLETFRSKQDTDYLIRVCSYGNKETDLDKTTVRNGNTITCFVKDEYIKEITIASLLASYGMTHLFMEHDAFILHASYIINNGEALLFTAPSGTGKSTQASLWQEFRGSEIINGDRVLITKRNGQFFANGIYVSGTSGICGNKSVPISAVILLEQHKTNQRMEIPARMLFLRILCECTYNMNDRKQCEKITEIISDMINTLPVICYGCTNTSDAVDALERILLWKKDRE